MTATEQRLGQEPMDLTAPADDDLTLWSVTSIIGVLDKAGLMWWAAGMTADAAIDNQKTWQAMLEEQGRQEAWKWLRSAHKRRPKNQLSASDLGTVVHDVNETYALTGTRPDEDYVRDLIFRKGGDFVDLDTETLVAQRMVDQFERWANHFQPAYQATEVCIYSPTYGYAGTADGFCTIDGTRFLLDYKALDRNTPLATPDGWTTMGAISVGDKVFGTDGHPVTVTAKSRIHQRGCYRVTFDDATSIVCDGDHLWTVFSTYNNPAHNSKTLRTDQIAATIRNPVTKQRHWAIHLPDPLQLPAADLPIDPYVYGCWLGDGHRDSGLISKPDEELFDLIRARGYEVGERIGKPRGNADCRSRTVFGLRKQLRLAGLLGHRQIPRQYLRASITQRIDLMRGLMDTDGSWNKTRTQAVFSTVNKATAETMYELVVSLGERPLLNTSQAHGFGKTVTVYQITWRPQKHNPFCLSRKASRVGLSAGTSWRRLIVSIEPTVTVPTQCITVDAADGCYLAGTQMVPTHNTTRDPYDGQGKPKTPYPEQNALQLAAYRNAEMAAVWRPRRFEKQSRRYYALSPAEREMAVAVPEVDTGLIVHITPEACDAYPVRCDEPVHRSFLYVLEAARWVNETSKTVMGEPLS